MPITVRENDHQLVDTLPDDRLTDVLDYLADLSDTDEMSPETQSAIKEGLEDIQAGPPSVLRNAAASASETGKSNELGCKLTIQGS